MKTSVVKMIKLTFDLALLLGAIIFFLLFIFVGETLGHRYPAFQSAPEKNSLRTLADK